MDIRDSMLGVERQEQWLWAGCGKRWGSEKLLEEMALELNLQDLLGPWGK